jgi:hypothetical protein
VGFTFIPFLSMSLRELHFGGGGLDTYKKINPFLLGVFKKVYLYQQVKMFQREAIL